MPFLSLITYHCATPTSEMEFFNLTRRPKAKKVKRPHLGALRKTNMKDNKTETLSFIFEHPDCLYETFMVVKIVHAFLIFQL